MLERNIKYISGSDGKVREVILPISMFREMVETIEDKNLLSLMKEVEAKSHRYLSEEEAFELIDNLIEEKEIYRNYP
jgi:hypothetical protein